MASSPLRASPLLVGLAIRESPVSDCSSPELPSTFDVRIMHREVPATLSDTVVTRDATDTSLSSAFRVPEPLVRSEWLTSRTPIIDPRIERDEMPFLYRGRCPVDLDALQRYHDLAAELRIRLQDLLEEDTCLTSEDRRKYYASPTQPKKGELEEEGSSTSRMADSESLTNDALCNADCALSEASEVSSEEADEEGCGFAPRDRHPDLMRDGAMLVRTGGGLYRTARHANGIGKGESCYAELYINYSGGTGGIAAGLCVGNMPLTKMVGGETGSVALHSSANVVRSGLWEPNGQHFGTGDIIGILAEVSEEGRVVLTVTINGEFEKEIVDEEMNALVAQGGRVHFAVSLYRVGARVSLRCCPGDWHFTPFAEHKHTRALCQRYCANSDTEPIGKPTSNEETSQKVNAQCTSVLTPWL